MGRLKVHTHMHVAKCCNANLNVIESCTNLPQQHPSYVRVSVSFQGDSCEIDLNTCRSNPCLNDGTCENLRNEYSCACPPGYTDYNCGEIDDCVIAPCEHGTCMVGLIAPRLAVMVLLLVYEHLIKC